MFVLHLVLKQDKSPQSDHSQPLVQSLCGWGVRLWERDEVVFLGPSAKCPCQVAERRISIMSPTILPQCGIFLQLKGLKSVINMVHHPRWEPLLPYSQWPFGHLRKGAWKKSKKKITSVSFVYVCVAENVRFFPLFSHDNNLKDNSLSE